MKELKWTGHYHKREDGIGEDVHWMPYPHNKKEPTPYYKTSTSFTLTKTIEYDNMDVLREHADNLERLQNEKFTLFHVPEFEFVVCENYLQYTCQFIKGKRAKPERVQHLYNEIVLRDSEYSFCDYNLDNFIRVYQGDLGSSKEYQGAVYSIDLTSYRRMPVEQRKQLWIRQKEKWNRWLPP